MKFNKFFVTDGTNKARVSYHLDNRGDGRQCVTLYAKDYGSALGRMFPEQYKNGTDIMTDYFEKGRVVLFEDYPFYAHARQRAMINDADMKIKAEHRRAKWAQASNTSLATA
jgi:hypothetical protein